MSELSTFLGIVALCTLSFFLGVLWEARNQKRERAKKEATP